MEEEAIKLEYNAIKQEIYTLANCIDQLFMCEFTVSITMLAAGSEFKNPYFYVLAIIFNIVLQSMINQRHLHMARASVYIETYIEPKNKYLYWEGFVAQVDTRYLEKKRYSKGIINLAYMVEGFGPLSISSALLVVYFFDVSKNGLNALEGFLLLIMAMCLVYMFKMFYDYINFKKNRRDYYDIMQEIENGKKRK